MKRMAFIPALFLAGLLISGCGVGIIYTHTWQPLTVDAHQTPVVQSEKSGAIKHIQLPYVGVAWDSAGFGDIAKEHGIKELYFADLETLRVLTIWNQYTVHLYGK